MKITLFITASILLSACISSKTSSIPKQTNSLSAKQKSDGWVLLFNGTSTAGWHTFGDKPIDKKWSVQNSELFLNAKGNANAHGGSDIVTDEEFENFHLKFDWKIAQGGNSGIMFFVKEDKKYIAPWQTGPEIQLLDNAGHAEGKIKTHRAGDLFDLLSISKDIINPANQWNTFEIVANKGNLTLYANGQNVLQTTLWSNEWKTLVATSKFKDMPDFSIYKKGKIALQDHGDDIWFRNIMIKKL